MQGAHRDDERDVGLSVAGHVRAAVSERRVDGEFEGTQRCFMDITHQDVVVQAFGLLAVSDFFMCSPPPRLPFLRTEAFTSTDLTLCRLDGVTICLYERFWWSNHASLGHGWSGFIGSHLIDRLVARGDEVVVIDNPSSGDLSFIQAHLDTGAVVLVNGDICNLGDVGRGWRWTLTACFTSLPTRTSVPHPHHGHRSQAGHGGNVQHRRSHASQRSEGHRLCLKFRCLRRKRPHAHTETTAPACPSRSTV